MSSHFFDVRKFLSIYYVSITLWIFSFIHLFLGHENWYNCVTCGKTYTKSHNLSRHVQYECGKQKSLQCPDCEYKFKRKDHLKRHYRRVHMAYFENLANGGQKM